MSSTITDQTLLIELQYALLEPLTPTGFMASVRWTQAEALSAVAEAQVTLLRDTTCMVAPILLPSTPNVTRHPLPESILTIRRVTWTTPAGAILPLFRTSRRAMALAEPQWGHQAFSRAEHYIESDLPMLQLETAPPAIQGGVITVWASTIPDPPLTNVGTVVSVPDDLAPYVKWHALGTLLSKHGRGADHTRAQYAFSRYAEGVALAASVAAGWR